MGPVLVICFFSLHWITCLSIFSHTRLTLLIAWKLLCYLHFAFCLFVPLIKLKCTPHLYHHLDCLKGSYTAWSRELLGRPQKVGDLRPPLRTIHIHMYTYTYICSIYSILYVYIYIYITARLGGIEVLGT